MRTETGIHRLPIEMVTRILRQLDLKVLVRASHVCRPWRVLALDDPLYWRNISIRDVSPQTLDFAEHRLACGNGRTGVSFEIDYRRQDRMVELRLLPLLSAAMPYVRVLMVRVESFYRFQTEKVLSAEAGNLEIFHLLYGSDPKPDLFLDLTLSHELFAGAAGKLKQVRLRNIIIGRKPIPAFQNVEEMWWLHHMGTRQEDFPCYLFDFFPKVRRFRMCGGQVWFRNAPLPPKVIDIFSRLKWLDIEFQEASLTAFFRHLPMDSIDEIVIGGAEFDTVYTALEPLRSYFDVALTATYAGEFYITIKGQSHLIRHFSEKQLFYKEYLRDSDMVNCIFEDAAFFAQLASLQIQTSLWALLHPWMPALTHLPKLIVEIDDDRAVLPEETLVCPALSTLVVQAKGEYARVDAGDLVAFVDRVTTDRVALQLRRVLVDGQRELLASRFETVDYSTQRYLIVRVP
ncbi:hypothetical protein AURDEDRAFT_166457 [Auricularia subglabra TFB-10046 SS5]|nr:hypothetical protein AURDEDRAFT_166457 [Auricularia subglabra TFB-10046 SS5]